MTIAVLEYSAGEVDIIYDVPEMSDNEQIEEWLTDYCEYNTDEISWLVKNDSHIKVNNLTPEDFG